MTARKLLMAAGFLSVTACAVAWGQGAAPRAPEIETVTVTGARLPEEVIHAFVQSYAHMTSSSFQIITRWKKPLCIGTDGLASEQLNLFVTQRVSQIAVQAGAEVEAAPCKYNVEVIFTSNPQGFLDKLRVDGPALLGGKRSQLPVTAVMRHPIQAWYATGIEDRNGTLILNDEEDTRFIGSTSGGQGLTVFATTPTLNAEGSLLRSGLRSEMAHVYVLADSNKTGDFRLGPMADYIAMLALTQADAFLECRPLPSITNWFAPDCGEALKPANITDADIAYLRGLYRMDPGANMQLQQSVIAGEVDKAVRDKIK